ncbi:hypothetical protein ANN_22151 [Periplaneta americana]|uniref:Uncharacterized protein n=1 Tax=Periplaneta americana TaxID=6978 RepID=A0ABQ8S7P6_PERAM|nr:hypothetical protein ANN_22151 [Periplaneta americana]
MLSQSRSSLACLDLVGNREWEQRTGLFLLKVVVITEDVQNVHLLLEYRPHIGVSLTCEHDPKLQEYCVCPQNLPQFDSEGIPNQAPETNKPMILNGPTSRNREGSDQPGRVPLQGDSLPPGRGIESAHRTETMHNVQSFDMPALETLERFQSKTLRTSGNI